MNMSYGVFMNYVYALADYQKEYFKRLATAVRIGSHADDDKWEEYINGD